MSNTSIKKGTLLLFTTLFFVFSFSMSCSTLEDLAGSIQKPQLSVTDMRVTGFSFDEIEVTYDVEIDNPNPVAINLSSYNYDFKLNDESFINGEQQRSMQISASDRSVIEVPVSLNFAKVYRGIQALASADQASYEFLSELSFDLPVLGITTIPVRKQGMLPMVKTPKISIENLEVRNLSLTQADLALNLEFSNPNSFGINIKDFNYDLTINGSQWAEGRSLENRVITEKGSTRLALPISLNIAEMGLSAYRLLSGSEDLNYSLNGTFNLGTTHPLLVETDLTIDRSGSLSLMKN